jgi:hypothetical protein
LLSSTARFSFLASHHLLNALLNFRSYDRNVMPIVNNQVTSSRAFSGIWAHTRNFLNVLAQLTFSQAALGGFLSAMRVTASGH